MAKLNFSAEEKERLIEIVRKNTELFDLSDQKYRDATHKDNIWLDIANTLGKPVEDCKKKWKYIRDSHNCCKRKLGTGSASSAKKNLPSAFFNLTFCLSFLDTVDNERSSTCNITPHTEEKTVEEDTVIDGVSPLQEEDSPECSFVDKPDKRARSKRDKLGILLAKKTEERNRTFKRIEEQNQILLNAKKCEDDDIDLFFKSLALTVKKLSKMAIKEAKLKALIMVNELEEKYIDTSQVYSRTFCPIQTSNNYQYSNASSPSLVAYSMTDNQSSTSSDFFQLQTTPSTSFHTPSNSGLQNDEYFQNK